MFVDSHCHLDRVDLDYLQDNADLSLVIDQAKQAQVDHMLCISVDLKSAQTVKSIAKRFENVFASVGVHPLDLEESLCAQALLSAANDQKVVAIGETGLDYFYTKETIKEQQNNLIIHLQVADQLGLPVIIHTRDASADTLAILTEYASRKHAGVIHCFTEDLAMAEACIELGFYISFSGIVTFKNAKVLQEVAKNIPLDRMLIETDSPYLTPVPFRGKPNFPKHVRDVAAFIAELRNEPIGIIGRQTTENFFNLFTKAIR